MGAILVALMLLALVAVCVGVYAYRVRMAMNDHATAAEGAWERVWEALQTNTILIPMLVHKVREYTNFEQELFQDADHAMSLTAEVHNPRDLPIAENATRDVLRRLSLLDSDYPPLGLDPDYLDLRARAKDNEMSVQFAREAYNQHAKRLNEKISQGYLGRYWAKQDNRRALPLIDLYENTVVHANGRPSTKLAPTSI